jgi:hypothetical protein
MASSVYTSAKYLMATDSLGWANGAIVFRAMLVSPSYAFNHVQGAVADVVAHEVSGGTYARINVTGRLVQLDLAGDRALCRANNAVFPLLTGVTASGLIIYKQVGGDDATPSNDPLICFIDFPTTAATGLNYAVEFAPDGVFALSQC